MKDERKAPDGSAHDGPGDLWLIEVHYWRQQYRSRPYVTADRSFEYYEPAYRYGVQAAQRHRGKSWEEIEADLRRGWEPPGQRAATAWAEIRHAVRDAWEHVVNAADTVLGVERKHPPG